MSGATFDADANTDLSDSIVGTARAALGDTLRSVILFTPGEFDVLYVRADVHGTPEETRGVKSRLVDIERVGFAELPVRNALGSERPGGIGHYSFTVRVHDDGFVARVLEGGRGVLLTTDAMDVGAFEEAAVAVRGLLGGD